MTVKESSLESFFGEKQEYDKAAVAGLLIFGIQQQEKMSREVTFAVLSYDLKKQVVEVG
jgi:hypothetical protein